MFDHSSEIDIQILRIILSLNTSVAYRVQSEMGYSAVFVILLLSRHRCVAVPLLVKIIPCYFRTKVWHNLKKYCRGQWFTVPLGKTFKQFWIKIQCSWKKMTSAKFRSFFPAYYLVCVITSHIHYTLQIIHTFCDLYCCGYSYNRWFMWDSCSYSFRLLHCHWLSHKIGPMPIK